MDSWSVDLVGGERARLRSRGSGGWGSGGGLVGGLAACYWYVYSDWRVVT